MESYSPRTSIPAIPALACFLFATVLVLFAPSIRYGFVALDDPSYVTKNSLVLSGLSFRSIREAFTGGLFGGMYIPLLWVSYMADVTVWGASAANPAPFHAVNVALHAADAVLFFFLLLRLFPSRGGPPLARTIFPFILALLWAVHPLRVESVAWITERKDVLSLFFALLSIHAYVHAMSVSGGGGHPSYRRGLFFLLSVLAFAAALLVKPSLVPFPLLLLFIDILPLHRPLSFHLLLAKLPWGLLSAAAVGATLVGHADTAVTLPLSVRFARLPQTLAYYLRITVLPVRLTVLEPDPEFALLPTVLCTILLTALLLLAFRSRRTTPAVTLGILWFFLFLLPFSGLVPIPNATVVDRFAYFPALGLSIALIPVFAPETASARIRRTAGILAFAAVALLAVLTHRLLPVWRSSESLYERVRRFSPENRFLVLHDFHCAIAGSGDFPTARDIASRALARTPNNVQVIICLAFCIANQDGPQAAYDFLSERRPDSHFFGEWAWAMATLALRLGRPADALAFADLAENALEPHAPLRGNIARLRTAASSPDPADALPHYISQWMAYERADALEFFRRFLAAYPARPDYLANVAWFLSTSDWSPAPPSEALGYASRALALAGPRPPPELLDTYAAALANAGDFPAATAAEEQAIALLPTSSPSLPDYHTRLDLYRQSMPYRHDIGDQ